MVQPTEIKFRTGEVEVDLEGKSWKEGKRALPFLYSQHRGERI